MSKKDEALKLALEALEGSTDKTLSIRAMKALREALAEQPAVQQPDAIVTSLTAGPDGLARSGLDRELPLMAGVYLAPQPAQQQEPVAWMTQARNFVHLQEFTEAEAKLYGWKAVYTTPQPAQRKPLTPSEVHGMAEAHGIDGDARHWYVVGLTDGEAKHGIKENT